jgi:hypothetical protein
VDLRDDFMVALGVKNDALVGLVGLGLVGLDGALAERSVIVLGVPEMRGVGGLTPGGDSVNGWVMVGRMSGEEGGEYPMGEVGVSSKEGSVEEVLILEGDMVK